MLGLRFGSTHSPKLVAGTQSYISSTFGAQSSGTFTVPPYAFKLRIALSGAGGGGGGNLGPGCGGVNHNSGSGGGGAGYFIGTVRVTPGQVLTFSLGYGGAGGTSKNNSGTFEGEGCTNGYSGTLSTVTGTNLLITCNGGSFGRGPGNLVGEGQRSAFNNCGHAPNIGGIGGTASYTGSAIITGTAYTGSNGASGATGCESCCAIGGAGGASLAIAPLPTPACADGYDGGPGGAGGSGCGGNRPGSWGNTYSPRSAGTGGWGGQGYVEFNWGPLI